MMKNEKKIGRKTLENKGQTLKPATLGFTLIELLAVIVILAVIALIATPLIMNIINDSKKGAAKDSLYNYIDAITYRLYKSSNEGKIDANTLKINSKGNLVDEATNEEFIVESKGTRPTEGYISTTSDGKIGAAVIMNNYCVVKYLLKDEVTTYDDKSKCNKDIASNLLMNGFGELGDNTNFTSYIYNSDHSLSRTSSSAGSITSDTFIPIDGSKKYQISLDIKSSNPDATYYAGLAEYDIDKNFMYSHTVFYGDGTLTALKKDLNNGDTVVYLDSTTSFDNSDSLPTHRLGLIFWNYKDSTGYQYPELTYSRNSFDNLFAATGINKDNHTISLLQAWNKGFVKAGTKLSQTLGGGQFNYSVLAEKKLTTNFTNYKGYVSGFGTNKGNYSKEKFRPGTKYIKFFLYDNYSSTPNTTTTIRNISIQEVK